MATRENLAKPIAIEAPKFPNVNIHNLGWLFVVV
jgi:hypothetical protein